MRNSLQVLKSVLLLTVLCLTPAFSQDFVPFKDNKAAHSIYDKMIRAIREATSFSYESEYRFSENNKEIFHSTYRIWLQKPGYVHMEGITVDGKTNGVMIGDGENIWIHWLESRPRYGNEDSKAYALSNKNVYLQQSYTPGHYSIAHQVNKLGTNIIMTILEPSIFHGSIDPLAKYIDSMTMISTDTIDEEVCDHIGVTFMDGQRSKFIWISQHDHLPRMMKEVTHTEEEIVATEKWKNIKLNETFSPDLFTWNPPNDWVQWYEPRLESGLLKPQTKAPDFTVPLITGEPFTLSAQHGNVVLLTFWRVGCPPCREEAPYLEMLHKQFNKKGLLILGFNVSDDKQIALEMLSKNKITYANIIDTSSRAQQICFEQYQTIGGMSAVPLNYLIDTKGVIVDSWYGYTKDDGHLMALLSKLGFHSE